MTTNRITVVTQTTLRRAAGSSNFQTTNQIALGTEGKFSSFIPRVDPLCDFPSPLVLNL